MPFIEETYNLSLDELSLLILTNDGTGPTPLIKDESLYKRITRILFGLDIEEKVYTDNIYVLTTKETYIWGIIISRIVQSNPEVNEEEIISAYRQALQRNKEYLLRYYSDVSFDSYSKFPEPYFFIYERLYRDILISFQERLKVNIDPYELGVAEDKAFKSLVNAGLIEDPIFTTILGYSIAVSGFIPYGFTKKKRKGKTVYRKIEAVFWSYLKDENSKGTTTTKINFRLWKILTAFKKALAETTAEEVDKK